MNIVVDCEASGPCIGCGDLIEFAAVSETGITYVSQKLAPLFPAYNQGAYQALGITREIHETYTGDIAVEAASFSKWLEQFDNCIFWSDNPAFDWQWINWMFHSNDLGNPFGFSARRIGDLYAGLNANIHSTRNWKRFRKTKHTHDPLDDAMGNMEAFQEIRKKFKI